MKQKEYFIGCPHDISFIHNGRAFTMQTMDIPQAFYSIIGIMAEDSNYHIHSCSFINRCLDIEGYYHGKKSYCRIQFSWGYDNNIIVQSVTMIHQRHGYMTQLYNVLKHIKRTYRTGDIIIQSVVSDEGKNWCRKHNLVPDGNGNYVSKKTVNQSSIS